MTMRYVQDRHGQVITGFYASEIREAAYQIWYKLLLRGITPPKWSQVPLVAADFYYQEMSYRFLELRLCGGSPAHWKARHVATDNYPAFVQGLSHKNMIHHLKQAPSCFGKRRTPPDHETESEMVLLSDLSPSSLAP